VTNADLATCAVTNDKVRLCWGEKILDELGIMPQAFLEPAETWAQPWSPGRFVGMDRLTLSP
jgi:hypothetical protein